MGNGTDTLTLTNVLVSPSDVITCTVMATDDQGDSATSSASVTVDNSNPTIDSLVLTPNSGVDSETSLQCTYTASDLDGESVTATYTWMNTTTNSVYTSTTDTLQLTTSDTSPNDVVQCTVVIADTSGGSATNSVSVTVDNDSNLYQYG